MVMNLVTSIVNPLVSALLKLYGLSSQTVEINPGTVIHFWAPRKTTPKTKNDDKNNKPALVLIHGFAGTGVLTWLPQVAAFAGRYAVYVPDLVFFGGSSSMDGNRARVPAFQAECLARGLRRLGVERCVVVGCSYGGIVGTTLAVESDPRLVRCLVLSNSNVGVTVSQSRAVFERVRVGSWAELLLPETVEGLKRLLRSVVVRRPWLPDWAYRHYLEVMFDYRKERTELIEAAMIKDNEFTLPKFTQKIYFVTGEEDKIFDINVIRDTVSNLGENVTLHCIKKAGHLVHLERPFVYNRLLNKILASMEAQN